MIDEIQNQFKKTPWILLSRDCESMYCEHCMERAQCVGVDPDELIEFSKRHEACGEGKEHE